MKIVLYQPQIPQNTGNIGRLCVATQTELALIKPLGFFLDSAAIRRSGLDYWQHLKYQLYENLESCLKEADSFWFLSTKGKRSYHQVNYSKNDFLIFGNEGSGLPAEVFEKYPDRILTIPMWGPIRSLNLASSASIVLYHAYTNIQAF